MRRFLKALAGGVTLCILLSLCGFDGQCQAVRNNVVRLHILANSDTAEDQTLKLKVRDAVTETAGLTVQTEKRRHWHKLKSVCPRCRRSRRRSCIRTGTPIPGR